MPARNNAVFSAAALMLSIIFRLSSPAEAASPDDMVAKLDRWIDAHTALPAALRPVTIRLAAPTPGRDASDAAMAIGRRVRGLYDPDSATITLVRPWHDDDPTDVSVLLHELIHHRQAGRHFYCPAAQELAAYRLQERWLADRGLKLDVNWIAVVLASSCAPRDVHPD